MEVMTPPRIVTFCSLDSPPREQFIAAFYVGEKRLPVIFASETEEGAIGAAEKWWADEQAKETRKQELAAERSERMRKKV